MSGNLRNVGRRVDGKRYVAVSEAHRTMYVTGAIDMLNFTSIYLSPRYSARLRMILTYANQQPPDVLRRILDEFVGLSAERQQFGACGALATALDARTPPNPVELGNRHYHPQTGNEIRRRAGTVAIQYAIFFLLFFLIAVGSGRLAHWIGLRGAAWLLVQVGVLGAFFGVASFVYNKFFVGRPMPPWFFKFHFREIIPSVDQEQKFAANATALIKGGSYCEIAEGLRATYVTGALDMLSYIEFFLMPGFRKRVELAIKCSGSRPSSAVVQQLDEFMKNHVEDREFSAANCLFVALEQSSQEFGSDQQQKSSEQLSEFGGTSDALKPTLVSYTAGFTPTDAEGGKKGTYH